jgi:hypothetical protein
MGSTTSSADVPRSSQSSASVEAISDARAADLQAFTLARKHIGEARLAGARTYGDLARVLNNKRVKAPSGRRWSAASVARCLLR